MRTVQPRSCHIPPVFAKKGPRARANALHPRASVAFAVMRRLFSSLAASFVFLLLLAPAALATENDGRGFYGATDDKVVTKAGFILVIFFPTFALLASLLQRHLERRKDARKAAHKSHAGDAHWRGGW
jgi:hypothetical protein